MIGETYKIKNLGNQEDFYFISEGRNGNILKYVSFTLMNNLTYNLEFGDWGNEGVSDLVISNNADLVKVMNTIGKIIYQFFETHPEDKIEIRSVDEKRSRLYHTIFNRRIQEINPIFVLEGSTDGDTWEAFNPEKIYKIFRLAKR